MEPSTSKSFSGERGQASRHRSALQAPPRRARRARRARQARQARQARRARRAPASRTRSRSSRGSARSQRRRPGAIVAICRLIAAPDEQQIELRRGRGPCGLCQAARLRRRLQHGEGALRFLREEPHFARATRRGTSESSHPGGVADAAAQDAFGASASRRQRVVNAKRIGRSNRTLPERPCRAPPR